jgi:signal transduction histidine kinase/ActR/RegA family two-component response regulator
VETYLSKALNDGQSVHETLQHGVGDLAVQEFAPRSEWNVMCDSDHFVQFYETEAFLLNSLSGYVGKGLETGDACIVVATQAHREALEEQLKAQGLDVAAASRVGQYFSLDATETLSKFMVDGQPELGRFNQIIGDIVARAAVGGRRVRAFGEMVALLWAEGNQTAAIHLEEFWNDLQKTHAFSLFCAYEMSAFGGEQFIEPLSNVCATHSRVIPAESYSDLTNADERLRAIIELQQKARSLEAEIAERKQAEERLRVSLLQEQMARTEAEHANRLKDEFLATVSHELRTPLHAVIGWSHMLRTGGLDEATTARAIETIERNAKSQAQLIEDILDVSRVITGKLHLNIGLVDFASVINAAIDSVQLAAESKDIRLEIMLDPSARRVSGDPGRLQQVIWNLLSNAIKFTPAGGRVQVRLERAGAEAQISVSDTGEGISADFLPFIFDRFRQADGSSTRKHGGLGLGLAIVRHLVEIHGGTVSANSPGKGFGATFTLRLPLAAAQADAKGRRAEVESLLSGEPTIAQLKPLPSLEGVQVLIVDDEQDTLNMLAVMLTEYRAKVQTARSAAEALEVLQWYKPDVLVSDLAMPGEDGYSLIGKVRAMFEGKGQRIPAVALTAYVRVEDRVRALSAGFNMFVPKPVEPNELITAIANLAEPAIVDSIQSHLEIM